MNYQLDFSGLTPYYGDLIQGIWITVQLAVVTTLLGVGVGILGAAVRIRPAGILKRLVGAYVEVVRNTPFIVQLFFIFFGLPAIGIKLSAWEAGVIAMVVNLGAYSTEIIRAGIEAIPKGQWEAAKTLGLKPTQVFVRVILPQAFHRISPALISQCIIVMLGSSVLSQISVEELTFTANFIQSRNFLSFESYLVSAAIYLGLALVMRWVLVQLSNKLFKTHVMGRVA